MELEWSKIEAEKLALHYKSFVSDLESEALKALTLKGLKQFADFSDVCREASGVAQNVTNTLIEKYQDPMLKGALLSLCDGKLSDSPADMIASFEKSNELRKRLVEMTIQRDSFIQEYSTLFGGSLHEATRAAKSLTAKVEGGGILPGLSESVLLDVGGTLIPGLGTVAFLKRRVLNRAKHLHERLQKSASIADSFVIFSEFMEQITEQMKFAAVAIEEDAVILGNFVEFELPARIAEINALKKD